MKLLPALLVALLLLVNLQACSFRSDPLPVLSGRALGPNEARLLLEKLKNRSSELLSFRLLARSKISLAGSNSSVRHAVVFEAPDKLRLETLPFNSAYTLALFVLNGQKVAFFDPGSKKVSLSTADGSQLRRLLGVPIKEQNLPYFLLARLPQELIERLRSDAYSKIYYEQSKNAYFVVLGEFEYFFEVDAASFLLKRVEIRNPLSNRLRTKVIYADPKDSGTQTTYRQISLIFPKEKASTTLKIGSISLNQPIPTHLFEVSVPADYLIESNSTSSE